MLPLRDIEFAERTLAEKLRVCYRLSAYHDKPASQIGRTANSGDRPKIAFAAARPVVTSSVNITKG